MTEANGPAAGTAVDNRAGGETASGDNGSNSGGNEAWSGLSEDNRSFVEAKGWKSPDDSIGSYKELESRLGKSIALPGDNDPPEKWDGVYSKLGWPDKPDGYEFKLDTASVPEDFPYEQESADWFRSAAHEAKLTAKQAKALHDAFVSNRVEQFTAGKEQQAQAAQELENRITAQHREIVGKWGETDTATYKENVLWADRALRETGLRESFEKAGLLGKDNAVLDAKAAFALAEIGQRMYGEDATGNPLSKAQMSNPFSKDNRNLSEQSRLVNLAKTDPSQREGVQRIIRQAGLDPAKFGI